MSRSAIFLAAVVLASAAPGTSQAAYMIYNCGATHAATNTNAKLANSITCNPSNGDVGVTLNSGADLDMNGMTITCASGQTCAAAVTMTANSSLVVGGGTVVGSFTKIVDCGAKTGSRVTGLTFDGASTYGMYNCAQLDGNVLMGDGTGQAVTTTTATNPTISDNYIADFNNGILYTGSTAGGTVNRNVFNGAIDRPIYFQNWGSATITNNVFLQADDETNPAIDVGSLDAGTYSNNICDASSTGCATCVSAGRCTTFPAAPFGLCQ